MSLVRLRTTAEEKARAHFAEADSRQSEVARKQIDKRSGFARDVRAEKANTRTILKVLDQKNARGLRGQPVTCSKGCSACCNQWVGVTYLEAYEAVKEADRVGFVIDAERVSALAKQITGVSRNDWFARGEPCIFLRDDGACGVWRGRPVACRAVNVSSPKEQCEPGGTPKRYDNRADVFAAYQTLWAEHARALLSPVVAALPVMVKLVLEGKTPTELGQSSGVYGLNSDA